MLYSQVKEFSPHLRSCCGNKRDLLLLNRIGPGTLLIIIKSGQFLTFHLKDKLRNQSSNPNVIKGTTNFLRSRETIH